MIYSHFWFRNNEFSRDAFMGETHFTMDRLHPSFLFSSSPVKCQPQIEMNELTYLTYLSLISGEWYCQLLIDCPRGSWRESFANALKEMANI